MEHIHTGEVVKVGAGGRSQRALARVLRQREPEETAGTTGGRTRGLSQKPADEAGKGGTAKQVSQHICQMDKGRALRKDKCKY